MSNKKTIFVTGVTGYIGGSVLSRLLNLPEVSSYEITTLVRSQEKAEKLKVLGVSATVGSYDDISLVENLASEADIVIAMADADHLPGAQATLRGLKKRFEQTKAPPIFIHTSGTGVLADKAAGNYQTETIYNDADADQIETLAPTQIHRNVDLEIIDADKQGYVKTYIVIPSTIYGLAKNELVELGIQKDHSIQIPQLIAACLDRGQGGMVGKGINLWPDVSVDDIADLYIVLFKSILSNPATGHGREGIYFGENGEHSLYEIGHAIGQALVDLGKSSTSEPTTFTAEEIVKYFRGSAYLGSNSRCRANRSRSIGWKPVHTKQDMLASIKPEVEVMIKKSVTLRQGD